MEILLYILAFYGLLWVANYVIILQRLLAATFQYVRYTLTSSDHVPAYLESLLAVPCQELEEYGFEFCHYFDLENIDGSQYWGALLYHPSTFAYATLQTHTLPDAANSVQTSFFSFVHPPSNSRSPTLLLTMNGLAHAVIDTIPHTVLQDPYAPEVKEQWRIHKTQLKALSAQGEVQKLTPEAFIEAITEHEREYIDQLLHRRVLAKLPEPARFQIQWLPALNATGKIISGTSKQANMLKRRRDDARLKRVTQVHIPVEVEVDAFRRLERAETHRPRRGIKWGILGLSAVVFAISFTPLMAWSYLDVLILVAVLLLHELGHFLAMRLFRYENTAIFFLPFFGAAASGRKDHATLNEKFWVLLAGPLPGLLLGIGMAIAVATKTDPLTIPEWADMGVIFLIVLNYLNLLPILPLDGGRIVNLLLFSRVVWAEISFKILTIAVLVLLGATGAFFFLVLAVILGFGLPESFRTARIIRHIDRSSLSSDSPDSTVVAIFHALKQNPDLDVLPFIQKYTLVKSLRQRLQEPHASWLNRIALFLLYVFCVVGGLIGAVYGVLGMTTQSGWIPL